MSKDYFIQLTQNLYRLTLLFPKKEPLRYKMREVADDILINFFKEQNPEALKDLEILDSFFELAKSQNWVKKEEILKIQEEYIKLKEDFKRLKIEEKEVVQPKIEVRPSLLLRQQRILEILRERGGVQVWEIKEIFPEVSKRTLRRDFKDLLKKGLIERIGEKNNTSYQIITRPTERGPQ